MRALVEAGRTARRSVFGPAGVGFPRRRSGFTLIDVLVSIAVIAVLISLMLPSLGTVKETAHQVACRSNVRQIGLAIAMYADDRQDLLPSSFYVRYTTQPGWQDKPAETVTLRLEDGSWDGLGRLFRTEYLPVGPVFYCPSHKRDHRYEAYEGQWRGMPGKIEGNYQYRGLGPNRSIFLNAIEPSRAALVADSLRTKLDFNHEVGANVLRADLSVYWYRDNGSLLNLLDNGDQITSFQNMNFAWQKLDGGG